MDGRHNARVELPSGTVTMLFSDVEGSTKLLAALGDQYGEVLSTQRRLLDRRVGARRAGGHVRIDLPAGRGSAARR